MREGSNKFRRLGVVSDELKGCQTDKASQIRQVVPEAGPGSCPGTRGSCTISLSSSANRVISEAFFGHSLWLVHVASVKHHRL